MKKILLHDIQYNIGGPNTVLNNIEHSYLGHKYNFKRICQIGGCGLNPIKALKFIRHYKILIDNEHADVIYICGLQYVGFLMTFAAKLSNVKKIIISIHGSDWDVKDYTLRRFILKYIIEPLEVHMADKIFTVCNAEQRIVKALKFAKKGSYIGTIYNTFPNINYKKIKSGKLTSIIGNFQEKIVVASVGRVTERKGHRYIIDAIKKNKDENYVFVIIGDGDYLQHYKDECKNEIDEKRLFLLGNRNDVIAILRDVDIFLFATLNENHSMALLEAVNMRCAALVTNVGGNIEIIQNEISGIVIPPANSEAIIDGLYKLKDKKKRDTYANAAYNYCKKTFSINNTLRKLDKLFDAQPAHN